MAAEYPPGETLTLDRESTVEDICDFIVEYINSDVLVGSHHIAITMIDTFNRVFCQTGFLSLQVRLLSYIRASN